MNMPLPPRPPEDLGAHTRLALWLQRRIDAMARTARHPVFWAGAREMVGVSIGLTAWSFMTGVAMVKAGLSIPTAVLTSLLVFAGSAQLTALPLIVAGAPLWVIWAAAFCVNLRFVVFSLHLRDYLMFLPRARRLYMTYFTGDVTYVLFTKRYPEPAQTERQQHAQRAYLWGGNTCNWVFWQTFSMLGIFLGAALPAEWGLEYSGILALLVLACSLAIARLRVIAALVAAVVAVATQALPFRLNILVAVAVAVGVALLLESRFPVAEEAE